MSVAADEVSTALEGALSSCNDIEIATNELEATWRAELAESRKRARGYQARIMKQRSELREVLSKGLHLADALGNDRDSARLVGRIASSQSCAASVALRNVSQTLQLVEFLDVCPRLVHEAVDMLDKVSEAKPGSQGIASNIFRAHENIVACERIRDIVLLDVLPNLESATQVARLFDSIDEAREQLEHYLLANIFSDVPRYAHADPRALVAAVRIVEREEEEDSWWNRYLSQTGFVSAGPLVRPFGERHYKRRMREVLVSAIATSLQERPCTSAEPDEVMAWVKTLVVEERNVRRFVVPCFPPSHNVGMLYSREYHRHIMTSLTDLLSGSSGYRHAPNQIDIFEIIQWYGENGPNRNTTSGSEDVDFAVDADSSARLTAELAKQSRRRLLNRMEEILTQESRAAVRHEYAADDSNSSASDSSGSNGGGGIRRDIGTGICSTGAPEQLFSALSHQAKNMQVLAMPSVNTAIAHVVAEVINEYQRRVDGMFQQEADEDGNPLSMLNAEYVCAVANNMSRCLEYAEEIRGPLVLSAEKACRSEVSGKLEAAFDRFRACAAVAVDDLVAGFRLEIEPIASRFFAPCTGTEVMLDVLEVANDSFRRFEMWLQPFHFEHFAAGCLKAIALLYVTPFLADAAPAPSGTSGATSRSMFSRNVSIRSSGTNARPASGMFGEMNADALVAQIEKDVGGLSSFFERSVKWTERKQVEAILEFVFALRNLLTCPPTTQALALAHLHGTEVSARMFGERKLTLDISKKLWASRTDVSAAILPEASSRAKSLLAGLAYPEHLNSVENREQDGFRSRERLQYARVP